MNFEIRIKDSGMGISAENQDKLFMNFSRLDEHSKQNQRGTGLGLSICKSLIEMMGGSVHVESKLNEGTTFIMKMRSKYREVTYEEAMEMSSSIFKRSKTRNSKISKGPLVG